MFGTRRPLMDLFRLHLRVADFLATFGFFSLIFGYVTGWQAYVPPRSQQLSIFAWKQAVASFFQDSGPAPLLGLAAILVYVLGRSFARYSVELLPKVFTDSRMPTATTIDTPLGVFTKTYGQLLLVVAMLVASNFVLAFCGFLIALHSYYWWFNDAQQRHMNEFFSAERYSPENTHPHREYIMRRRQAVRDYLYRYHGAREIVVIIFALAALAVYFGLAAPWVRNPTLASYSLIITGMFLNETVVWLWRAQLKRRVARITAEETQADIARNL